MNDQTSITFLQLALDLAAKGLPVFPCNPANKRPYTDHGFKDASKDPAKVAAFWTQHPRALIGIPTGQASGIFALDLDTDDGTGEALGEAWLARVGLADLLQGPGAITPSGGRHIYFRADGLAEGLRNTTNKPLGVDTRGDGGYIIAPGSIAAKGAYSAVNGGLDAPILPALPKALQEALQAIKGMPAAATPFQIDTGYSRCGTTPADLAEVQEVLRHIPPDGSYDDWLAVLMGLHDHFAGSGEGLAVADAWSAPYAQYKPGEVAAKWRSFQAGGGKGWASVCQMARQNGADLSDIARRHRGKPSHGEAGLTHRPFDHRHKEAEPPEAVFFCAADLHGKPVPIRQWLVPDLVPAGTVTTLNGDGGTGKSLVALQLAVSTALGRSWMGQSVTGGGALFISAEDDRDEIHRRVADVAAAEGVGLADLDKLTLRSLAGKDALLAIPTTGDVMAETPLFLHLDKWLSEHRPTLTVLDTLADLFGGNEVNRSQARQFIGMLRRLCLDHETTIILLAHPSLAGMSSGTGSSGSTAWNNSVRSRLYLRRVKDGDGYEADTDARELEVMKANYGKTGLVLPLRWQAGAFVADIRVEGALDRMAASAKAERVFLKLLRQYASEGRYVSINGPTSAPKEFSTHPAAEGCRKIALKAAMDSLLHKGKVRIGKHGTGAKERNHIEEVQPHD